MTNYFENITTMTELKKTFRTLVKKYHPDVYGSKGNEILKEIKNQLEKAIKTIDKDYFKAKDIKDDEKTKAKKKRFAQEALKSKDPEFALFTSYFLNQLKPQAHRNPLTNRMFHGRNVWTLELNYVLQDYSSCEWSTPMQYKKAENLINKGERSTYLTLAVYANEKDENGKEKEVFKYFKGYIVFNYEQTKKFLESKSDAKNEVLQISESIEDKEDIIEEIIEEQKTLDLWDEYEIVA